MQHTITRRICVSALFAALIYVFTAFLHVPSYNGYTHIGDGFIFLAASLLPAPYAMAASVIGAGLSDILSGYTLWFPGTAVIKALTALCFTAKNEKILCKRNLLGLIPALVLCAGGYYLYNALVISRSFAAPLAEIPGNLIQWALSSVVYVVLGKLLDSAKLKNRLGAI